MITINFVSNKNFNLAFGKNVSLESFTAASLQARKALNVKSEASRFFGVDKRENVMQNLTNHINLVLLKSKDLGILSSFPKRAIFSVDKPNTLVKAWHHIWDSAKGRKFDELLKNPARLTFDGKFFGEGGMEGSHTIGMLYEPKTKTLFCLDSLSNFCKQVKKYQEILMNKIFNSPNGEIKKIIFSNKPQQYVNEYTCNNWTIANIEALKMALKQGKNIDSTEKLNEVLPDDINEILLKQYKYVLKNSKSNKKMWLKFY